MIYIKKKKFVEISRIICILIWLNKCAENQKFLRQPFLSSTDIHRVFYMYCFITPVSEHSFFFNKKTLWQSCFPVNFAVVPWISLLFLQECCGQLIRWFIKIGEGIRVNILCYEYDFRFLFRWGIQSVVVTLHTLKRFKNLRFLE